MSDPDALNPCPHCKAPATLNRSTSDNPRKFFIECSNGVDCHVWPETRWHASATEACAEWNNEISKP